MLIRVSGVVGLGEWGGCGGVQSHFVSNPTTVLRLCCVVVGVVTILSAIAKILLPLSL